MKSPRLLQINITANWGSHGKIAEGIGRVAMNNGWESFIAYGRYANSSSSQLFHIGSMMDEYIHGIGSRLLDNHGLMSSSATKKLITFIKELRPNIIHLHNIHGYYINYELLFQYLSTVDIPVVWTLHDCWTFTGHCAHYMFVHCEKWKTECHHCPQLSTYPKSWWVDASRRNFRKKRELFQSPSKLTLVPVSKWLETQIKQSFFFNQSIHQIYNGIDINVFKPVADSAVIKHKFGIDPNKKIILGVASSWYRKGLDDFFKLRTMLGNDYDILLVGVPKNKKNEIAGAGMIPIDRTQNVHELVAMYTCADVFFNPTWEDTLSLTNLEAMACGTPVVAYDTGGVGETITPNTGFVINCGNVEHAMNAIVSITNGKSGILPEKCIENVRKKFCQNDRFTEYLKLYEQLL